MHCIISVQRQALICYNSNWARIKWKELVDCKSYKFSNAWLAPVQIAFVTLVERHLEHTKSHTHTETHADLSGETAQLIINRRTSNQPIHKICYQMSNHSTFLFRSLHRSISTEMDICFFHLAFFFCKSHCKLQQINSIQWPIISHWFFFNGNFNLRFCAEESFAQINSMHTGKTNHVDG